MPNTWDYNCLAADRHCPFPPGSIRLPSVRQRGFGADDGKSKNNSDMDYPCFANAIDKAGFNLSEPETKQVFNEFRLAGPSGKAARVFRKGVQQECPI